MRKPLSSAGTPLTETLSPSIPLDQIGQTLASIYDDLVSEGVPEHLAALVRRVRQSEAEPAAPHPAQPAATEAVAQRLALVVEDDPQIRALAETLLEETELDV
ncbi:MAG: response regulator receiver protein, partial [Methylobacterium brachiatum]|nr:response regulator receiver protein [Methylobacterium brachiatum]